MQNSLLVSQLEYVTWHDASIKKISFFPEGNLEISFKHLRSFHKISFEKIEVWDSTATILLKEVSFFSSTNVISNTYIDGVLLDSKGNEVSLVPIHTEHEIASVKIFDLGSGGGIINIIAKHAIIIKFQPIKWLEDCKDEHFILD